MQPRFSLGKNFMPKCCPVEKSHEAVTRFVISQAEPRDRIFTLLMRHRTEQPMSLTIAQVSPLGQSGAAGNLNRCSPVADRWRPV
jgi:hypothetical protein